MEGIIVIEDSYIEIIGKNSFKTIDGEGFELTPDAREEICGGIGLAYVAMIRTEEEFKRFIEELKNLGYKIQEKEGEGHQLISSETDAFNTEGFIEGTVSLDRVLGNLESDSEIPITDTGVSMPKKKHRSSGARKLL